jgi:hypothetical protein
MIEGTGSVSLTKGSGSRRPKTYGSDPNTLDMEKLWQVQEIPASKLKVKLNLGSVGGQGGFKRLTAVFA